MTDFDGFPVAALDFYDDLEMDNTRSFWENRKTIYTESVRAPMTALCAGLEPEFGPAKVFRPYRDVRFAKDKTPYKTHQGAFVAAGPATGWYVEVSAAGVRVGVGFYDADRERLAAIREAIADDRTGGELVGLVERLTSDGWELRGDTVKTAPRGYDTGHPRIALLRHKSLYLGRSYGFQDGIHSSELLDWVKRDWRVGRPVVEWVNAHGG